MTPLIASIPAELRERNQWVAWNLEAPKAGRKATKVPKDPQNGGNASCDSPDTWGTFDQALSLARRHNLSGIGFEFSVDDPFAGIDLDGCRDPESGTIAEWAQTIIDRMDSYAEVSPSGSGVKIFIRGRLPIKNTGRANENLQEEPITDAKTPGIEIYHHGRYFAITGQHVEGTPTTIEYRQADLDDLWKEHFGDDRHGHGVDGEHRAADSGDHHQTTDPNDVLTAIACLQTLGAEFYDNYDKWLRVGMILHSVDSGQEMFSVWDAWSRNSKKHAPGACAEKWATFKTGENGKRLTIATIVHYANESGAQNDGKFPASTMGWEEPASLDAVDVPHFPAEGVFSNELHEYVAAVAESLQVPQDMVAMMTLGVFGLALAKKIEVHVQGDHREPVNVFVVNVAPSSERKSAVCHELAAPLHKYEHSVNAELEPEIAVYESRKRTLAKKLSAAETAAASSKGDLDRQSAERERDDLARELAALEKNAVRKLALSVGSDCTPERLVGILGEQGGRLGLIDSEGGLFSMMRGRYAKNAEPNTDAYCKAYSGDDIRVDRVKKPTEMVKKPALTIVVFVQPEILRGMVTTSHLRGVGLLGRFWYVLAQSYVGHRELTPDPIPAEVRATYERVVRAALELEGPRDDQGERNPYILKLEPAVLEEWLGFANRVETGLRDGGELDGIGDWGGKIAGGAARIAGILHGIAHGATGTINKATMEGAIKVGSYLIEHAKAAFLEMGTDPDVELARRIVVWIKDRGLTEFSRRDVHARFQARDRKVNELDEPLRLLKQTGHIREMTKQPGLTGGRPSRRFAVNPRLNGKRQELSGQAIGGQK